jgi:aryl-alcohol dehydrogenase-like predicted oxidoreductase
VSAAPIDPRETRPLGRTAVRVTRLGFGSAPLGNLFRPLDETGQRIPAELWRSLKAEDLVRPDAPTPG